MSSLGKETVNLNKASKAEGSSYAAGRAARGELASGLCLLVTVAGWQAGCPLLCFVGPRRARVLLYRPVYGSCIYIKLD